MGVRFRRHATSSRNPVLVHIVQCPFQTWIFCDLALFQKTQPTKTENQRLYVPGATK